MWQKRCAAPEDHDPHEHETHVGPSWCDGRARLCRIGTCDNQAKPGEVCRMHASPPDLDLLWKYDRRAFAKSGAAGAAVEGLAGARDALAKAKGKP